MSAEGPRLSDSAFIADLSPRERSFWRFFATLVAGATGGFIVALVVGAAALVAIAAITGAFSAGVGALPHQINALIGVEGESLKSALVLLTLATATNGPMAAVFIAVAALISGRKVMSYLTVARTIRWRLLLMGLVLSFVAIGPLVAAGQLMDPKAPVAPVLALAKDWPGRVGYAVACIVLLIPAAAAEEVVFRGWLLRQSSAVIRNPFVLMALNGLVFSAVHGEFAPDPFLTRTLMGAGFVYMTLRLGGIEFSTGAHAANNILIVLFIQPISLKATPSTAFNMDSLFQDAFLLACYVLMAELVARWGPLRRWSGLEAPAAPAVAAAPATGPWG
jgi:membrane protease YdiL (CAAX protease family)